MPEASSCDATKKLQSSELNGIAPCTPMESRTPKPPSVKPSTPADSISLKLLLSFLLHHRTKVTRLPTTPSGGWGELLSIKHETKVRLVMRGMYGKLRMKR